jgi:uncharacterized protein (DUF2141 family)
MKNQFITWTGGVCFLFTSLLCQAQQTGTLTIEVTHFENTRGVAVVQLFREHDDIPEKPFLKSTGVIVIQKSTITLSNIPYGEYAAIVFHDENANGILDHKFGFPNEPMGFSNEWSLSLFSGMPTFNKLKFVFSAGHSTQDVKLK